MEDLVLLALRPPSLQLQLNAMANFAAEEAMQINVGKTEVPLL